MYSSFYNFLQSYQLLVTYANLIKINFSLAVVNLTTLRCAEQEALGLQPKTAKGVELSAM
jgi:hypothetical protein